jgi:hypothetical protein
MIVGCPSDLVYGNIGMVTLVDAAKIELDIVKLGSGSTAKSAPMQG